MISPTSLTCIFCMAIDTDWLQVETKSVVCLLVGGWVRIYRELEKEGTGIFPKVSEDNAFTSIFSLLKSTRRLPISFSEAVTETSMKFWAVLSKISWKKWPCSISLLSVKDCPTFSASLWSLKEEEMGREGVEEAVEDIGWGVVLARCSWSFLISWIGLLKIS